MKRLLPLLVFIIVILIVTIIMYQWKINFIEIYNINFYKTDEHEITTFRTTRHDNIIQLLVHSFNETEKVKEIPNIEGPNFHVTFEYESGRKKTVYLWISKDEEYAFYTKKKNATQVYKINEVNTNFLKAYLGFKND